MEAMLAKLERWWMVRDTRGAVSTEYVVLVGTIGLTAVFALVAVGPVLVKGFERSRNIITAPFP